MKEMFIGSLSRLSGASPKAIRLYEALGLLGRVPRRGDYRVYSQRHLRQVALIRQAQQLGFSLAELKPVLHAGGEAPDWQRLLHQVRDKRAALRQEMERLRTLETHLGEIEAEIRDCLDQRPQHADVSPGVPSTQERRACGPAAVHPA